MSTKELKKTQTRSYILLLAGEHEKFLRGGQNWEGKFAENKTKQNWPPEYPAYVKPLVCRTHSEPLDTGGFKEEWDHQRKAGGVDSAKLLYPLNAGKWKYDQKL